MHEPATVRKGGLPPVLIRFTLSLQKGERVSSSKSREAGDRSSGLDKPAKVVRWDPAAIQHKDLHQNMIDLEKDDEDEAEREKRRRRKKSKNKIALDDPYLVPPAKDKDDDDESIPDEKVNEEYLEMLFVTWESKENEKERKKLAQPHWLKDAEEPEAP